MSKDEDWVMPSPRASRDDLNLEKLKTGLPQLPIRSVA